MTSACDRCAKPGACCSGFPLTSGHLHAGTSEEVDRELREVVTGLYLSVPMRFHQNFDDLAADPEVTHLRVGLPFKPLFRRQDGQWRYWCPNLTLAGRCGDYENRPALCAYFEPGEASICCHHIPRHGLCVDRVSAAPHSGTGTGTGLLSRRQLERPRPWKDESDAYPKIDADPPGDGDAPGGAAAAD